MEYSESIERAAHFFLHESLPSNWEDLPESELLEYLEHHAWEPFEYYPGPDIWGMIDGLAHEFREIANITRQRALTGR